MTLAGSGYLLWLSWRLARAGDPVAGEATQKVPGFWSGMVIQGLNPKAWVAVLSALTTFVLPLPEPGSALGTFAVLFACVCWLSLALWAYGGARIGKRSFNRIMAALLVVSVLWMLWSVASA